MPSQAIDIVDDGVSVSLTHQTPLAAPPQEPQHHPAVASGPLHASSAAWTVRIDRLAAMSGFNAWVFVGVTANPDPPRASYADPTTYGWAGNRQVWSYGQERRGHGGWDRWRSGDLATLTLERRASGSTLRMIRQRGGSTATREFSLELPAAQGGWHVLIGLYGAGDQVTVSRNVTRAERASPALGGTEAGWRGRSVETASHPDAFSAFIDLLRSRLLGEAAEECCEATRGHAAEAREAELRRWPDVDDASC